MLVCPLVLSSLPRGWGWSVTCVVGEGDTCPVAEGGRGGEKKVEGEGGNGKNGSLEACKNVER